MIVMLPFTFGWFVSCTKLQEHAKSVGVFCQPQHSRKPLAAFWVSPVCFPGTADTLRYVEAGIIHSLKYRTCCTPIPRN